MVITCLPTSAHVKSVVGGEGGLAATLAPGSLVIDCTSGEPKLTRELAAELSARGIGFVDAPVSGGPQAAAAGTIAIIVGGTEEWYEQALLTLRRISPNVRHVGPVERRPCGQAAEQRARGRPPDARLRDGGRRGIAGG